jgi:hypothetical protein
MDTARDIIAQIEVYLILPEQAVIIVFSSFWKNL